MDHSIFYYNIETGIAYAHTKKGRTMRVSGLFPQSPFNSGLVYGWTRRTSHVLRDFGDARRKSSDFPIDGNRSDH